MSKWVSINKDGLPKKGQLVDVYDASNESRRTDCYYLPDQKTWLWRASRDVLKSRKITHWMSVPESPNQKQEQAKKEAVETGFTAHNNASRALCAMSPEGSCPERTADVYYCGEESDSACQHKQQAKPNVV